MRRIADRYIAGEEIDDAVATVAQLNEEGMTATIDVLGEEIHNAEEAQEIVDAYHDTLDAIKPKLEEDTAELLRRGNWGGAGRVP